MISLGAEHLCIISWLNTSWLCGFSALSTCETQLGKFLSPSVCIHPHDPSRSKHAVLGFFVKHSFKCSLNKYNTYSSLKPASTSCPESHFLFSHSSFSSWKRKLICLGVPFSSSSRGSCVWRSVPRGLVKENPPAPSINSLCLWVPRRVQTEELRQCIWSLGHPQISYHFRSSDKTESHSLNRQCRLWAPVVNTSSLSDSIAWEGSRNCRRNLSEALLRSILP